MDHVCDGTLLIGVMSMTVIKHKGCFMQVVLIQGSFPIHNILSGMIWFLLPASLIICNDISAFVWGKRVLVSRSGFVAIAFKTKTTGFFFGRTPLIQLSPKKTWEGFLGAFATTIVFGWFVSGDGRDFVIGFVSYGVHGSSPTSWCNIRTLRVRRLTSWSTQVATVTRYVSRKRVIVESVCILHVVITHLTKIPI